jgi:hypothetical protein
MVLVRYLMISGGISGDEVAVARSLSDSAYYVVRGTTLVCIPDLLITSKLYPQGVFDLPTIIEWIETHPDEARDVDFSLLDQFGSGTIH